MSKKSLIAGAVGSAFVASMAAAPLVSAAENPFALSGLSSGYQVADHHGAKPMSGESKAAPASADKMKDGKCGATTGKAADGKCGANAGKAADGKCGANAAKPADGAAGKK